MFRDDLRQRHRLRPDATGMIGPEVTLETVSRVFALKEDGGLTEVSRRGRFWCRATPWPAVSSSPSASLIRGCRPIWNI